MRRYTWSSAHVMATTEMHLEVVATATRLYAACHVAGISDSNRSYRDQCVSPEANMIDT